MVEVRLKPIADRLGKSISDIARETGLNRNTVTALYHGKVDGVKFATIDRLCDVYGIKLVDLIVRPQARVGAAPGSRVVREIRPDLPFFSWARLNALHMPSSSFFSGGIGKVYEFFVRDGAELYLDRTEANRSARAIMETYGRNDAAEVKVAFLQARDQLDAFIVGLSSQPIERFLSPDLVKTFKRLSELHADMLSLSAWIDLFDYGTRDETVVQVEKAHGLTRAETSLLLASGERTPAIERRLAALKAERKTTSDFSAQLANELEVLSSLPRAHADAVRAALRTHKMRANPLQFFATLAVWKEERDEADRSTRSQMERLLKVIAERSRIAYLAALYLLPQELEHALNGLVTERTLQSRREESVLITLEHGGYRAYEGAWAVSVQDDLVSRYMSQLAYGNV